MVLLVINFYVIIALISFLLSLICTTAGMGYGALEVPILILLGIDVKVAIFSVLIGQLSGNVIASILHHQLGNADFSANSIDLKRALILGVCGIFAAFGAFIATHMSSYIIKLYTGVLTMTTGATLFLLRNYNNSRTISLSKTAIIGAIASLNKAITGGNYGSIIVLGHTLLGFDIKRLVAIIGLSEILVCTIGAIFYFILGVNIDINLIIALCLSSVTSAIISPYVVKNTSHQNLKRIMGVVIAILGIFLIIKS